MPTLESGSGTGVLAGDRRSEAGPAISETQRQKVLRLIKSGLDAGATLITGGGIPAHLPRGYFIEPTLLSDVDVTSRIAQARSPEPIRNVRCGSHRVCAPER
jgi:aldehyde dehydrogenase (NAD+)